MCITDAAKIAAGKPTLCTPPVQTYKAKLQQCGPQITVGVHVYDVETWSNCAETLFWCYAISLTTLVPYEDVQRWPSGAIARAQLRRLLFLGL
jgi:hypothetical protein